MNLFCKSALAPLLFALPLLCAAPAHADSNPKKLPDVSVALQRSRTIYLLPDDTAAGSPPSPTFLEYYNALQSNGRFQLVPSANQADLVLRFLKDGKHLDVKVIDTRTINSVGLFWTKQDNNAAANLMKQTLVFIGASRATTPHSPLPAPTTVPAFFTEDALKPALGAHAPVFVVDGGVPSGFPPKNFGYQPGELGASLAQHLPRALPGIRLTTSMDSADLVFNIYGYYDADTEVVGHTHDPAHTEITSTTYTPSVELAIYDAKTLRVVKTFDQTAITRVSAPNPSPRDTDAHTLTLALELWYEAPPPTPKPPKHKKK